MVLAACYAGTLASRGQLDPSSLLSFTQLSWRIGESIGQLLFLSGEASNTVDALGRLQAIIEREPRISPEHGATIARDSPFLRGEMALHDVSFAYASRPDSPALHGCSLTLRPGQVTRALRALRVAAMEVGVLHWGCRHGHLGLACSPGCIPERAAARAGDRARRSVWRRQDDRDQLARPLLRA